jgi:hypothetical protein
MKARAAVPANGTAIALGLGISIVPGITGSAVDGLAAGVLLAGVCFALFLAWRRGALSRAQPPAPEARPASVASAVTLPDLFRAAPVTSPCGIEADERLEPQDPVSYRERAPHPDCLPGRSRHGLAQTAPISWRSLLVPTSPRHAAPSPIISAVATGIDVLTTKFAVRPLPVRN